MAALSRPIAVVHSRGPGDPGALDREISVQTIVIANPKGGSGKTTLATNVAGWLAGKRQRVVLADADPQRSASQWLGRRPPLFPAIVGQDGDAKKKDLKDFDPQWRGIKTAGGAKRETLQHAVGY